jgi:hypothetical protein
MKRSDVRIGLVCGLAACSAWGCTKYYRVTDPVSGNVYHTNKVERSHRGGFVEFKDARTGEEITLQSSQVAEVTKYEFQRDTLDK